MSFDECPDSGYVVWAMCVRCGIMEADGVSLSGSHLLVRFGCNFVADLAKLLKVGFISSGEAPVVYILWYW